MFHRPSALFFHRGLHDDSPSIELWKSRDAESALVALINSRAKWEFYFLFEETRVDAESNQHSTSTLA